LFLEAPSQVDESHDRSKLLLLYTSVVWLGLMILYLILLL